MKMKRFYTSVAVQPVAAGFHVLLDRRPVRTPIKAPLRLPTQALAEAVAEEWAGQGESINLSELHLTQLAATAVDRLSLLRDEVIDTVTAYAHTDLLCHRVDHPLVLVERQQASWQPLLDWAALTFDAPLKVTHGIIPVPQPPEAVAALRSAVATYEDYHLAALQNATALLGSLVLGLALMTGRLRPDEAFDVAQLEETFQMERWGEDAEAAARRAAIRREVEATARFTRLLEQA